MNDSKEDCLLLMQRMEDIEANDPPMSPMLWDEVGWAMHYLVDIYKCDEEELKIKFPHLLNWK